MTENKAQALIRALLAAAGEPRSVARRAAACGRRREPWDERIPADKPWDERLPGDTPWDERLPGGSPWP